MKTERIKEIQEETPYPDSVSVQQALMKVWNECKQATHQEEGEEVFEIDCTVLSKEDQLKFRMLLNSGVIIKSTTLQISDWRKLREKFFRECVSGYIPEDATGFHPLGKELKSVAMAPHDLFEWFKKNLPNTQIREAAIADMIETYFKKWNGNGFDKPTPLERQGFEACANAITQLMKGGEG